MCSLVNILVLPGFEEYKVKTNYKMSGDIKKTM